MERFRATSSKTQPRGELGGARLPGARHHSEIRRAERESRNIEDRMIEQVVEFSAHVELEPFREEEALLQSRVRRHHRRPTQARAG